MRFPGTRIYALLCMVLIPLPLLSSQEYFNSRQWYVTPGFHDNWTRNPPDITSWRKSDSGRLDVRTLYPEASKNPFTFTAACRFSSPFPAGHEREVAALSLPRIGTNWAIYLNGRKLQSEVHLSEDGSKIVRQRSERQRIIPFPANLLQAEDNLLLVRIMGDPRYELTGITTDTMDIGFYREMEDGTKRQLNIGMIMVFFFAALYHLVLFYKRPGDRFYLFFALFTALSAAYMFFRAPSVFVMFPETDTGFLMRMEVTILFPLIALGIAFLESLLKGRISFIARSYGLFTLILLFPLWLVPLFALKYLLLLWQVIALVAIPYIFYVIIRSYRNKIEEARTLLAGVTVLLLVAVYDIIDAMFIQQYTGVFRFGFSVFLLGIIASLGNRFMRVHNEMESLSLHLEDKVEERTEELEAAMAELRATNEYITEINQIHERDMYLASMVQRGLIPWDRIYEEWDVQVLYKPTSTVSGDFYDIYVPNNDAITIILTDVSGHGVSSALITMIAKPLLYQTFGTRPDEPMSSLMSMANSQLTHYMGDTDKYLSAVGIRLGQDEASICNAGHPPVYYLSKMRGLISVGASGTFLGVREMKSEYTSEDIQVTSGDMILAYTDALIESRNSKGEEFGWERVVDILTRGEMKADELIDMLYRELMSFTGEDVLSDDLTIIACRKK